MTSESEQLARRAVACKAWRWMPGVLAQHPPLGPYSCSRVCEPADGDGWLVVRTGLDVGGAPPSWVGSWLPDLDDAATLGCLLALVREAWGDPLLHAEPEPNGSWMVWFRVTPRVGNRAGGGLTEAEALVAALEAAPVPQ